MRFDYIRVRGFGPFREEVFVDFSKLPQGLIALTGENGAGKSTFAELLPGAMYRQTATRGPLASLAKVRDAYVEIGITNGASYRIRQTVDCRTEKGESLVLDANGAPVLSDTKVSSMDRWSQAYLPAPSVLYSSTFLFQASAGFLDLTKAERKRVVLRALGIEHMEAEAQRAREQLKTARETFTKLVAELDEERKRAPQLMVVDLDLSEAEGERNEAERYRDESKLALADAEAAATNVAEALRDWQRRKNEARVLADALAELNRKISDIEPRIKNNRAVLAEQEAIEAAIAALSESKRLRTQATLDAGREKGHLDQTKREQTRNAARIAEVNKAIDAEDARATRAKGVLAMRDAVAAAAADLPGHEQAITIVRDGLEEAEAALETARGKRLAGAEERIEGLRVGLQKIATPHPQRRDGGPSASKIAADTLAADDHAVADAASAPAELRAAEAAVAKSRAAMRTAEKILADARALAARAAEMDRAQADYDAAIATEKQLREDLAGLEAEGAELARTHAEHKLGLDALNTEIAQHEKAIAAHEPNAAKAEPLAKAEARLAELEPQLDGLRVDVGKTQAKLDALGQIGDEPSAPDVARARARLADAEEALKAADYAAAQARANVDMARAAAARVDELSTKVAAAEEDVSDWTRLADDLGPNGIIALAIDAAGPEISATANELLHEAFGSRFTIRLETVRRSANDERDLEVFDVLVHDSKENREGEAKTFSGGERVFLSEALSLALAKRAARNSGAADCTLVRDESGAALDPGKGRAYVAMLRRAAKMIGASRCLFVSHNPELQELADARIEIADGKVTIG